MGKAISTGLFTAKHHPNILLTSLGATGLLIRVHLSDSGTRLHNWGGLAGHLGFDVTNDDHGRRLTIENHERKRLTDLNAGRGMRLSATRLSRLNEAQNSPEDISRVEMISSFDGTRFRSSTG